MQQRTWLLSVLILSFILLGTLKTHELKSLHSFYRAERTLKLSNFRKVGSDLTLKEKELLELWESFLTGRSAPLAKWMKEQYKELGLNHLFTPSGFHLTAVLAPILRLSSSIKFHLLTLALVGLGLLFVPGQAALKRMVLIKGNQRLCGTKAGFIVALLLDVLFGGFQTSALSFSYSFLFLGIIYSGLRRVGLALWFFTAQIILAYFQGNLISPLLLVFSPLLNLAFGLAMPWLFILALPLWDWQLFLGLQLLKLLQWLVELSTSMLIYVPFWEVHVGTLLVLGCVLWRKGKAAVLALLILSNGLNLDLQRTPSAANHHFIPRTAIIKVKKGEKEDIVYFADGKCKRRLVRGHWWEKCSPKRRRSTKRWN